MRPSFTKVNYHGLTLYKRFLWWSYFNKGLVKTKHSLEKLICHKNYICEILELAGISRKNNLKTVRLLKIILLVQTGGEVKALLCFNNSI